MSKRPNPEKFLQLEREKADEISSFLFALGNQFINVQNASAAFDCFKYSVDMNPKNDSSVYNLGCLYNVMGNHDGAFRMFKEALRMKPDNLMARTAMGEVARKLGRTEESLQILEEAYKLDPGSYAVLSAIAILKYDLGSLAEALEWNERAMEKKPGDVHLLLNKALIHMTYGEWPEYWSMYEYCLSYNKNERMRNLKMSDAWAGQECEGKTLIVISDQGSGDAMQFSRYLAEAKALGKFGKLIYLVQPDLKEMMERVDGIDMVVGYGERMHVDYDHYSSLLGIMRVLKISPKDCYRPPHLITDPRLDASWSHRVREFSGRGGKNVAIVWAGDPRHGNDHARSIPLGKFAKFLEAAEGVNFFSCQVGPPIQQLGSVQLPIIELGSEFRTFDDTASVLKHMDLLITCDTSVSHLAGCLGVPCWTLVPRPGEWRWLLDGGTTPWYRDHRIYRQPKPKDWDSVIDAVAKDIEDWSKQ